jgi:hypothetical protein
MLLFQSFARYQNFPTFILPMIETRTCLISLLDTDVLRIEYKKDAFVEVEDFEENLRAYKKLMTTEKAYLLTVARSGAEPSPEVREIYVSKERSSFKLAEAFVISSLAQRIIANFIMRVQRPVHRLRFFTSEEEAKKWLYRQRELISEEQVVRH